MADEIDNIAIERNKLLSNITYTENIIDSFTCITPIIVS